MRSCVPFRAALVPSIRRAYLPARTGSVTTLTPSFGAPFHWDASPVSKSPRQRTSADTVAADTRRNAAAARVMSPLPSAGRFQARQGPRRRAELVHTDAQPLQHAHVQVAQGWRVLGVELQVTAVLEPAAGHQDRQVLDRVAAPVAQVAAEEDGRPVEQGRALLLRLPELREQVAEGLHRLGL